MYYKQCTTFTLKSMQLTSVLLLIGRYILLLVVVNHLYS